jgi:hypothetical protein
VTSVREPEIFCPQCTWRPLGTSRWLCTPKMGGCGTIWNTFWTGGVCPGCSYRWEITICLACRKFSPHRDWYHWPEPATHEERHEREAEDSR